MSLRQLFIDIGFNVDDGPLQSADNSVDDLIDKVHNSSSKVDNLAGKFTDVGNTMTGVGKKMTLGITTPLLAVGTAAAGLTAKFGWDRLVQTDTAQAKLKGLGYSTEDVGRISDQVATSIQGGMTTMAEGTAVAAGALAAGVEEGKELERYIGLVGDAAVGAGRPVDDMAQIFNRVQGSGKLMTKELNMIEQGMPGFASTMAESLGVSTDKFSEMVTAGEVSSDQFLDVMDDFAGGMAGAYADSWQGMLANTKSYIGMIGESLLGGVFEKSKESITAFIELLSSDEVQEWAAQTGEKIGATFSSIVDIIGSAINWFRNLNPAVQSILVKVAIFGTIFMAALGPVILIAGKIAIAIGALLPVISKVMGAVKLIGGALGFIANPVTWIIAGIALIIGALVLAYNKIDWFRDMVDTAWNWIKDITVTVFQGIMDFFAQVFEVAKQIFDEFLVFVVSLWDNHLSGIVDTVVNIFTAVWEFILTIVDVIKEVFLGFWEFVQSLWVDYGQELLASTIEVFTSIWDGIVEVFDTLIEFFVSIWEGITELWNEHGQGLLEITMEIFQWVHEFIVEVLTFIREFIGEFVEMVVELWNNHSDLIMPIVEGLFTFIQVIVTSVIGFVQGFIQAALAVIQAIFNAVFPIIKLIVSETWQTIKSLTTMVFNVIKSIISGALSAIQGIFNAVFPAIQSIVNLVWNAIKLIIQSGLAIIGGLIDAALSLIKGDWEGAWNAIKGIGESIWNNIESFFSNVSLVQIGKDIINGLIEGIKSMAGAAIDTVKDIGGNIKDTLTSFFSIGSPSRLMETLFGFVGDGAIKGLEGKQKEIDKTTKDIAELATPSMDNIIDLSDYRVINGDHIDESYENLIGDKSFSAVAHIEMDDIEDKHFRALADVINFDDIKNRKNPDDFNNSKGSENSDSGGGHISIGEVNINVENAGDEDPEEFGERLGSSFKREVYKQIDNYMEKKEARSV